MKLIQMGLIMVFLFCIIACEEPDKVNIHTIDGITDESLQNVKYVIYVDFIHGNTGAITLYSRWGEEGTYIIENVTVKIDSVEIESCGTNFSYIATFNFQQNQTYNIDISINQGDSQANVDLNIPFCPSYQEYEWDGLEDMSLTWSLPEDAMGQRKWIEYADNNNAFQYNITDISPSDRSCLLHAGQYGYPDEDGGFRISIIERNWAVDSNVLFIAESRHWLNYGCWDTDGEVGFPQRRKLHDIINDKASARNIFGMRVNRRQEINGSVQ